MEPATSLDSTDSAVRAARILIAEDERIVARGLQSQLRGLGYEVPVLAHSAQEALRQTEEHQPDLVLMDIQFNDGMDGVQAAEQIRSRFGIPVVFLTAYSNQDILDRAKVTQPYGYILKPYEEREVHVVIEMALHRHRMERKLDKETRFLAATLRSIGDGVIATDEQGRVSFLNPVAQQLTGWASAAAQGRPLEDVFHLIQEMSRQPIEAPLRRAMAEKVALPMENHAVLIACDGSERPVADCATPILDDKGVVLGGVMVFRDVSERHRLEAKYLQAQKMEAIGRLAGGVAHDFNNLLTVINGFSQMLESILHEQDVKARQFVAEIRKAGDRAASLTGQLLAYSRKQVQQLKVLNLNDLLPHTESMLRRMIGEDVELSTKLAPDLRCVMADPGQIEQVMMNLCVNARDAMPTGGKLTIETRNVMVDESDHARAFVVAPGPYVVIAVTDTGIGMDAETQANIFEPFFTTKALGKGTGLGLAMVYGIVKQSGGYINVYSEPMHGTTFKIYLPSIDQEAQPPLDEPPAEEIPGGTETVLLVEDEEAVRALTLYVLRQAGYKVLEASNGSEALKLVAQHQGPIDLLVTDVVMPKMGGRQVAEVVRQLYPHIRVLFLSGYADDAIVRHGILESESAFLQKPFSLTALATKLRELLAS